MWFIILRSACISLIPICAFSAEIPKKSFIKDGKKPYYRIKKKSDPPLATWEMASSKMLRADADSAASFSAAVSSSKATDDQLTGYRIIDIALLGDILQAIPCKKCKQQEWLCYER